MDFSLTDDQESARELAATIFGDLSTHEALRAVEATEERFDEKLWSALAEAGLLGLSVPEAYGGAGLGFIESCVLAEQVGRSAAAIPLVATLVLGAAPIATYGSDAAQSRWLPGVVSGETILSAALEEPGGDPMKPVTTAGLDGEGWRLSGTKTCVLAGMLAHALVVPARLAGDADAEGQVVAFVVPTDAEGLTRYRQVPTSGQPEAEVVLDGVRVGREDLLAGLDIRWLLERAESRALRADGGSLQGGRRDHRPVHERASPVRQAHRGVPGSRPKSGRCIRRRRGGEADCVAGGVEARRGPAGRRRGSDREILGRRRRPALRPRLPAPSRRCRSRPRLPGAPLVLDDQAPGPDPGRDLFEPSAPRQHPGLRLRAPAGARQSLRLM